jgi:hypothetical protein
MSRERKGRAPTYTAVDGAPDGLKAVGEAMVLKRTRGVLWGLRAALVPAHRRDRIPERVVVAVGQRS